MKNVTLFAVMGLLIGGLVSEAYGAILIKDMPDKGTVALSGIIEQVTGKSEFVLRDTSGLVPVTITSGQSMMLSPGEKVSVDGSVNNGFLGLTGKSVDATNVEVQKNVGSELSDAVAATTGISVDKAKSARISELPKQGMVRLLGTVDAVTDARSFTLKDASGTVDVKVQSDENVALRKGSEVTVIGYVDSGMLGKKIQATRVIASDNAIPSVGG